MLQTLFRQKSVHINKAIENYYFGNHVLTVYLQIYTLCASHIPK